jgi:hypothetical protein
VPSILIYRHHAHSLNLPRLLPFSPDRNARNGRKWMLKMTRAAWLGEGFTPPNTQPAGKRITPNRLPPLTNQQPTPKCLPPAQGRNPSVFSFFAQEMKTRSCNHLLEISAQESSQMKRFASSQKFLDTLKHIKSFDSSN